MSIIREIKSRVLLRYYQWVLDNTYRLLSKRLIREPRISKDSPDFFTYARLLLFFAQTLSVLREEDSFFVYRLQKKRLGKVLQCARKAPWWEKRLPAESRVDLTSIAPISRAHLTKVPLRNLMTSFPKLSEITFNRTSGSTTGTPLIWVYDNATLVLALSAFHLKSFLDTGLDFKKLMRQDFLVYVNYNGGENGVSRWLSNFSTALEVRGSDSKIKKSLSLLYDYAEKLKGGGVLRTTPSELLFLARKIQDIHMPVPRFSLCTITGQACEEPARLFLENFFHCPVVPVYSTQEGLLVGVGCRGGQGVYHVQIERMILEILDDSGKTLPKGEWGNITLTCLDNFLMPLIRYQPGDVGRLIEKCGCGEKTPLFEIKSRTTDYLYFSDGTKMTLRRVFRLLLEPPFFANVIRYQIRQKEPDQITIAFEVRKECDTSQFKDLFKREIESRYRGKLQVSIEFTKFSEEGKFRVFIPLSSKIPSPDSQESLSI